MSCSNRNVPFSMQSEFDSDEEDSDCDMLVIDEESEFYDQRRRKTPEAREDSGNQQYMEGYYSDGLVMDCNSEDESVFERSVANGRQRPPISPPLQEVRQVPRANRSRSKSNDKEEEAMDQGGENGPGSPQEVDLMHFAPMYVQDTDEWPKPVRMSKIRLRRNENFSGDWKVEMRDANDDYYKSNNHFVWTNQLVVGRGVEVNPEENWLSRGYRADENITENPQNPEVQKLPENNFRLKETDFGYGLFAEGLISKGSFEVIFVV